MAFSVVDRISPSERQGVGEVTRAVACTDNSPATLITDTLASAMAEALEDSHEIQVTEVKGKGEPFLGIRA